MNSQSTRELPAISSMRIRRRCNIGSKAGILFLSVFLSSITKCASFSALPPAAEPIKSYKSAADVPVIGVDPDPYEMSPFDRILFGVFRWTLQRQTGVVLADRPGFEGLAGELRQYQRTHTLEEQAAASENTMKALAGPIPTIFRSLVPAKYSPALLAFSTKLFTGFLVGPTTITQRAPGDDRAGGILVNRCSVLEHSECKGVCMRMCKLPTEKFFAEEWGTPLTMTPNFETYQCQLSFGKEPLNPEDDPSLPQGCLQQCPLSPNGDC